MVLKDSLSRMGKIIHPLNEMNIAGNMNQFWFNLRELGKDIREDRYHKDPSLLFEDVDLEREYDEYFSRPVHASLKGLGTLRFSDYMSRVKRSISNWQRKSSKT